MRRQNRVCTARRCDRSSATRRLFTAIAGAILIAACGGTAPAPEQSAARIGLEHITTIGCDACDDQRQITPVALAILDNERIAVLDAFEPFVRIFGIDGELQSSFGSKGQGPGELGMSLPSTPYMPGMWLFGNDLGGVTVLDIMPFSLEAFDAEGEFVDSTDSGLSMAVPTAQAFDPETRTYYRMSFSFGPGGTTHRISRCRFPAVGEAQCGEFTDPARFLQDEGLPGASLGSLVLAATPDGSLVVANAGSYDIWVLDDQGEIVMRSGRELPPPRKSDAELEQERQRRSAMGQPEADIDPNRLHIESYGIQADGSGRIWVLTGRYDDDSVFDVFATDGEFLNEVVVDATIRRTSTSITPFVVRGDLLAAAARQPDGNLRVELFRIVTR